MNRDTDSSLLYRETFAHSSEAITNIGTVGVYVEQNEAHRALNGYDDRELRGRTPEIHLGDERFAERRD